jgi:bifunctional UDP-N-acetylglucosamine pyrophosphorylase/glucosamine-1-phosphate N-acetyltransferase
MLDIVIMAGGRSRRMQSDIPKVLIECGGIPMIIRILKQIKLFDPNTVYVIVNPQTHDIIKNKIEEYDVSKKLNIEYSIQEVPLGTGHAIQSLFKNNINYIDSDVLIINGDMPLITYKTLYKIYREYILLNSRVSLVSCELDNPFGCGRIIENVSNEFVKIVEEKDCTDKERDIKKVNVGIYVIQMGLLKENIFKISNNNKQNEYYLTDLFEIIRNDYLEEGVKINVIEMDKDKHYEVLGANTKDELINLEKYIDNILV